MCIRDRFWIIQGLNSLSLGGLLFLLSSGFSLIFGLMRLANLTHGAFFMLETDPDAGAMLRLTATYGFGGRKSLSNEYRLKESLIGQCAFEKKRILLGDVPNDFIYVATGMGEARPRCVVVLPVSYTHLKGTSPRASTARRTASSREQASS